MDNVAASESPSGVSRNDFVWTLGQLCALHRVPFDPALFLGPFPPPYSQEKLFAALGALGFHAGRSEAATLDYESVSYPCIAFRREGNALIPAILTASDGAQLVTFESRRREPQSVPLAIFYETFDPVVLLLRRARSGGQTHYVAVSGEPVFDDQGRFKGYRGVANNVTEQMLAETKILRRTQFYSALSACNKAIVHSASEKELFAQICSAAVRFGGMTMAWIGKVERDSELIRIAASAGDQAAAYLEGARISVDAGSPFGQGPTGTAVRENRPVWIQDFRNEPPSAPWHKRRADFDLRSSATLPLRLNGEPVGVITLYAIEANAFDEAARNLLTEMAGDVSFALDNFDREARRRRATKELLAAEERFRGLVEQAIAGIYIIQDGKLVYANPRCAEIIGHGSPADLVGIDPLVWIVEEDHAAVKENLRRLFSGEAKSLAMEFGVRHRDGSAVRVGAHAARATYEGRPAIIGMVQDISEKKRAEEKIQRHVAQIKTALMGTVNVATTISEMRDPYTAGHERRVSEIALAIGTELGLDEGRLEGLGVAGHLHDIGKITIPSEILAKPGKLSAIEFKLIQGHAQAGHNVLKAVQFPWPVADTALQHHERLDGSGYPQGLKGDAILFEARIVAVADIIEAMSAHRPYRAGLGLEAALAQVERDAGTRLDAEVVAAGLRLFREKGFRLPS